MLEKTERGSECSERTRPFLTTKWDPGLIGSLVGVVRRDHWGIEEQKGRRVILGQSRSSEVFTIAGCFLNQFVCPSNRTSSLSILKILKENKID